MEDRDRAQEPVLRALCRSAYRAWTIAGFFSRLFTKPNDGRTAKKYRVALKGNGTGTTVTVLNDAGQPENTEIGKKILSLLDEQLH